MSEVNYSVAMTPHDDDFDCEVYAGGKAVAAIYRAERSVEYARLIAAAPEMKDALIAVVEELCEIYRVIADTRRDAAKRIESEPCLVEARAAIAKATQP